MEGRPCSARPGCGQTGLLGVPARGVLECESVASLRSLSWPGRNLRALVRRMRGTEVGVLRTVRAKKRNLKHAPLNAKGAALEISASIKPRPRGRKVQNAKTVRALAKQ